MPAEVEPIGDEEILCRLVRDRFNAPPGQYPLIWGNIFEFPKSFPESLFWPKYITPKEIHRKGCEWQLEKRKTNPVATYRGSVSGSAGEIRNFRNLHGHGFRVKHDPTEGAFHVHLFYDQADGVAFTRSDKNELKFALGRIFRDFDRHTCPSHVETGPPIGTA